MVWAVVAAEGDAGAEVGTLGAGVEKGVWAGCAVDGDPSVFVAVVSDVGVSLVAVAGRAVESSVADGTGGGVGAAAVVRSAAGVVGCLTVLAGDTSVDVVRVADGVPVVAAALVDEVTISAVTLAGTGVPEGL